MFAFKKGFTLIEVILVIVLITAMFGMAIPILGSFSKHDYSEKEVDEIKSFLGQVKYLKILNEENISIDCKDSRIIINSDSKELKNFKCGVKDDSTLTLVNGTSTLKFNINQYGYISAQRI